MVVGTLLAHKEKLIAHKAKVHKQIMHHAHHHGERFKQRRQSLTKHIAVCGKSPKKAAISAVPTFESAVVLRDCTPSALREPYSDC